MDPTPPGFDRLSLACRACGGVEMLDVQQGVMTPERLRNMWPRCSGCGSPDIELALRGASEPAAGAREFA
jgi:hypothetical protein